MEKKKMLNLIAVLAIANFVYGIFIGALLSFIEDVYIRQVIISLANVITFFIGYFVMKVSASSCGRNAGILIMAQSIFYMVLEVVKQASLAWGFALPDYWGAAIRVFDIAFVVPIGYLLYKEFKCMAAKLLRNGYWLSALCFMLILVVGSLDLGKEEQAVFGGLYSILLMVPLIIRLIGWVQLRKQV